MNQKERGCKECPYLDRCKFLPQLKELIKETPMSEGTETSITLLALDYLSWECQIAEEFKDFRNLSQANKDNLVIKWKTDEIQKQLNQMSPRKRHLVIRLVSAGYEPKPLVNLSESALERKFED